MIWGLLAEFETSGDLLAAARVAYASGYRHIEGYSPFPIPDLARSIGFRKTYVPLACLTGGIFGGAGIYLLQYWINVFAYPLNVGGRPLHSWPSFIPPTFEMAVLFAGFGAFFGMWALNGLPKLFHPLFNVERFKAASSDRFFLSIEASDPNFELENTRTFLLSLNPSVVEEVPYR
jgi:hypothetical protein